MMRERDEVGGLDLSAAGIVAELLFVLLPLVVITIIRLVDLETIGAIMRLPDWSFASAVLFGQSIVKLVGGVAAQRSPGRWEAISLVVSILVVLGLVPALVVLALTLSLESPPSGLIILQVLLFVVSIGVFATIGRLGHAMSRRPE